MYVSALAVQLCTWLYILTKETTCASPGVCYFRGAPAVLSALLCQAALSQLLLEDLSRFHCPEETEANQEEEQKPVCEFYFITFTKEVLFLSVLVF